MNGVRHIHSLHRRLSPAARVCREAVLENQFPQRAEVASILVVEPKREERAPLEAMLTAHGFDCHLCDVPQQAVALADREPIDIFISSAELGGESCIAVHARVVEACGQYVPTIFLSSSQWADIIHRQCGNHGMYFVRRPCGSEVLIALIERLLAVQRSGRAR